MNLYSPANARRSLLDTAAFRAISQISTALGYVILVRGMAEKDFGVLSLLYAFIPVVTTVASLGLPQVLMRYQPEYLRAGNLPAAAWLVRVVASARLVTSIVVLTAIFVGWSYFAPLFKLTPDTRLAFAGVSLLILFYLQLSLLQQALGSHMLHRYSVGSTTALSLIKTVLYGALYLRNSLTLELAIVVDTVATTFAYVSMRVIYQKKCLTPAARGGYRPDAAERTRLLKYALFNNFNDAGVLLLSGSIDSFFIAAFVSTTAVGIYSFYASLKQMIGNASPGRLFENVVRPLFFAVRPAEADRKIPNYFSFLLNINLLLYWPVLALCIACHSEIVQIVFAGKFIEYSWLLPVVMGFALLNTLADPASLVAQYAEKAHLLLLSKVFALYNLAAMATLIPVFGILGAVLASGTAQVMKNLFIWWQVRDRAKWTNGSAAVPVSLLLWGGGVAICVFVRSVWPAPALVHLCVAALVLTAIWLLYVRSAALSASDRMILAAVTSGQVRRMLTRLGVLSGIPAAQAAS